MSDDGEPLTSAGASGQEVQPSEPMPENACLLVGTGGGEGDCEAYLRNGLGGCIAGGLF